METQKVDGACSRSYRKAIADRSYNDIIIDDTCFKIYLMS